MRSTALLGLIAYVLAGACEARKLDATPSPDDARTVSVGGIYLYHGNNFRFGTTTLTQLREYCSSMTALSRSWHLATSREITIAAHFLSHAGGIWSDFSRVDLNAPGYVLVTGTTNPGYRSVEVYRLYGNRGFPALNQLGVGTVQVSGNDVETGLVTDGSGNTATLKVLCASN